MAEPSPNLKDRLLNDLGSSIGASTDRIGESAPPLHIPDHSLLRSIGKGSYGEVWLARTALGTFRAVKIVRRQAFDSDRPYEREFAGIRRFEPISRSHPSQLNVLHVGRDDATGLFYYVMELADSVPPIRQPVIYAGTVSPSLHTGMAALEPETYAPHTLRSELQRRGRLPCSECVDIATALATALDHLHRHGLVHRDIKPSNIVFVNGIPKLADIGLVTEAEATLSFVGTEGYLPPEGPGTPQADIFSLGKVLYEIATGRNRQDYPELPTNLIESPPEERAGLAELNEVIVRACDPDVKHRYQTAAELHADLALLQSGKSVSHLRAIERTVGRLKRAGIAITLIATLVSGAWLYQAEQTRRIKTLAAENLKLAKAAEAMAAESGQKELTARQDAYISTVNSAMHAYNDGNVGRARLLLSQLLPKPGERDLRGFEWRYFWGLVRDQASYTYRGHEAPVGGLDVSVDGKLVLSRSLDGVSKIWEYATGKEVTTWESFSTNESSLETLRWARFTSDGEHLLQLQHRKAPIRIWEISSKKLAETLPISAELNQENISPDRKALALIDPERHWITVWDMEEKHERFSFRDVDATAVEWSVDGSKIITRGPQIISVWDSLTKELLMRWDVPPHMRGHDYSVILRPGDTRVVTWFPAAMLDMVQLCDLNHFEVPNPLLKSQDRIMEVVGSKDGNLLALACAHTVKIWDLSGSDRTETLRGHVDQVGVVRFHPREQTVLSGSLDGTVKVWRYGLAETNSFSVLKKVITATAFLPGTSELLLGSVDGSVRICDLTGSNPDRILQGPGEGVVYAVASSPKDRAVAWAGHDIIVSEQKSGSQFKLIEKKLESPPVRALTFTSDGRTLISGNDEGKISLWDLRSGIKREEILADDIGSISLLAASPDNQWFATSSETNGTVRVWNPSARTTRTLEDSPGPVYTMAFSPDGSLLATGSWDDRLRLYKTGSWELLLDTLAHTGRISALAFSPDGKTLVTGSTDNSLKFWNVARHLEIASIPCDWPAELHFSSNGDYLVAKMADDVAISLSNRGKVRVFRAPTLQALEPAVHFRQ